MSAPVRPPSISRRTFLAGAAGTLLMMTLARCGGSDAPAPTTESIGGWVQPIARRSSDGQLSTTLRASEGPVLVGTRDIRALAYEQMYPGPTLEVRPGERLKVDLVNDSHQITNLHTHGLHVSPDKPSDDVLFGIPPGGRFHYEYDLPPDRPAGTYWYHAHYHPLTDGQVGAGLFGALIIRGDEDKVTGVERSGERVMIFSQVEVKDGAIVDADISFLSQQSTLVNGLYQPSLAIRPGEIQRWRFVNASVVFLRLQLDGHVLHKMAVDGNTLTHVSPERVVEIPPGGRVDVLMQTDREGQVRPALAQLRSAGRVQHVDGARPSTGAARRLSGQSGIPAAEVAPDARSVRRPSPGKDRLPAVVQTRGARAEGTHRQSDLQESAIPLLRQRPDLRPPPS